MKVIIVNLVRNEIIEEAEIPSCTLVNGMYIKELDMINATYVFKAEKKEYIESILKEVKESEQRHRALEANAWNKLAKCRVNQ